MKIETGKYYMTRDGRKVGPILYKVGNVWKADTGIYTEDFLIAPWYPAVGTLADIGAEVGDVVEWM